LLTKDDRLISANITSGEDEIILVTREGFAIRFNEKNLRPHGRISRGVKGIRFRHHSDSIVDLVTVNKSLIDEATLFTACERGFGKRSRIKDYRLTSRGRQGVINIKTTGRNGKVIGAKLVKDTDEVMLITEKGKAIRFAVKNVRLTGRAAQGIRLIKLAEDDRLISIALTTGR
jgi:DNA gyrase subunit A